MELKPLIPADGEWPCQADPNPPRDLPSRLVTFLYLLLRQEVLPGAVEDMAIQSGSIDGDPIFTNPHLESYARALANHLTTGLLPYQQKIMRDLDNWREITRDPDEDLDPSVECKLPPRGWYCTRPAGHEGSCPTSPKWWNLRAWWRFL